MILVVGLLLGQLVSLHLHVFCRGTWLPCQRQCAHAKHCRLLHHKSTSAAAGIDMQKDVLDLMGFKPLMSDVREMDHRCFVK